MSRAARSEQQKAAAEETSGEEPGLSMSEIQENRGECERGHQRAGKNGSYGGQIEGQRSGQPYRQRRTIRKQSQSCCRHQKGRWIKVRNERRLLPQLPGKRVLRGCGVQVGIVSFSRMAVDRHAARCPETQEIGADRFARWDR